MNKCFYRLSVIGGTKSRADHRENRCSKRGSALLYVRNVIRLTLLTEKVDAHDDTVLAIGKSLDAMVARRAQRLSASIALDVRDVLTVIRTIHLLLILDVSCSCDRFLI